MREGTVDRMGKYPGWMVIAWDDGGKPMICHQNELKVLPNDRDPVLAEAAAIESTTGK